MNVKSVGARWVRVPISPERQHVSDFERTLSFDGTLVRGGHRFRGGGNAETLAGKAGHRGADG